VRSPLIANHLPYLVAIDAPPYRPFPTDLLCEICTSLDLEKRSRPFPLVYSSRIGHRLSVLALCL